MSTDFVTMAMDIMTPLMDPATAHKAGSHVRDDDLVDLSPGATAALAATLRDASHALSQVDTDGLDPEERVDHAVLASTVDARLFALTETRDHEWNPLLHNPGPLLDALLRREYAPAAERLTHLANRLVAVPDALATARAMLTDMPAIHVRTAITQFTGTAALVRDEVPRLLVGEPRLAERVGSAREAALAALTEFVDWLRGRTGESGRDPRLGRPLWEAKLWHTLDTPMTAAELNRRAWAALESVTDEMHEVAATMTGGPPGDNTVRAALAAAADRRPDSGSIVELARTALAEATAFVDQFELVSLLTDPIEVREMPEYQRGVAGAYCDAPGPMAEGVMPTVYAIAPAPADWPASRVESFYREYNDDMMRNLTVHEAMPGHYLQLAHARRFAGSTPVRAVFTSGTFIEGWAAYAEHLMADHGFGGPAVRLQQLKMLLRTILNAILDQAVHCDGLSEPDAMALLTGRGFQEEGEAAGKWQRALLTSTQLSTYFVGYTELRALATRRPADTDLRAWHDALLAHGSPSPRHLHDILPTLPT